MIISMINRTAGADWVVRLGVSRSGGWRDWGAVSGQFERHLAAQASERIVEPHIDSESRRGSDHVRITVLMNVRAADVAEALSAAWWAFRKAADDGWDLSTAVAEVRPGEALAARAHHASPQCPLMDGSFDGIPCLREKTRNHCGHLPPQIGTLLANAHARVARAGRWVWPGARSLCLECSVRLPGQERTRSPSSTWKISPSWKTGPREQGSRYHKGKNHHAIQPIKPAAGPPGSQRSGQTPGISQRSQIGG